MIVKTGRSIYEIQQAGRRFRRIHLLGPPATALPIGQWFRFERMSAVRVGEPVRFFWLNGEEGRQARIGLWATGPVVEVVADEANPPYGGDRPGYLSFTPAEARRAP